MKTADANKLFIRGQLESITPVTKNQQKQVIADQVEEGRKVKEELEGGLNEESLSVRKPENLDDLIANKVDLNSISQLKKAIHSMDETGDIPALKKTLADLEKLHQLDPKVSKFILNAAEARKGYSAAARNL